MPSSGFAYVNSDVCLYENSYKYDFTIYERGRGKCAHMCIQLTLFFWLFSVKIYMENSKCSIKENELIHKQMFRKRDKTQAILSICQYNLRKSLRLICNITFIVFHLMSLTSTKHDRKTKIRNDAIKRVILCSCACVCRFFFSLRFRLAST